MGHYSVSEEVERRNAEADLQRKLDEALCWEAVRALVEEDNILPAVRYVGLLEDEGKEAP